ncbi:hypothetical protein MLD38_019943 [Melastoma candidum]|uniref:Uncharacterized protein n=1 Tax=Melastoma candidum TaxID=119954 RepID=A0ACB9QCD3_9MYRT|nr:hypothetical protein MLD38_019943 [Melastoma candidum]
MPRNYPPCHHMQICNYGCFENLVGLIVAVIGPTSQGKTTLAREIAKSLRCTFLEHDLLRSCFPPRVGSASDGDPDPAYLILWKMIQTHLAGRNHHIVVDYPLSRRVEIDRLLGIAESQDAVVILIDCELGRRSEARPHDRDGEATLARYLEWSLTMEEERVDNCFYDYDPSKIDVPRLVIGATSDAGFEEHVDAVKRLIQASLDEKFTITEGDRTMRWDCSRCDLDAVRRRFASFPKTFKHVLHDDEFHLYFSEDGMLDYTCGACLRRGENLCYNWVKGLRFHPECVLELPLEGKHKYHWHPLKLTLLPPKDDTDEYYCEVCAERRDADNWIYYCRDCEYEAHVPCVVPNLPGQPNSSSDEEDEVYEANKGEQGNSSREGSFLEIETREDQELEADSGSGSGSDLEVKPEDGLDEKARFFWEEIMERDRKLLERNWPMYNLIMPRSYGQNNSFQKRLLQEPGHVLVAMLIDPPGSMWVARPMAESLRCMCLYNDDLFSCLGIPDANADFVDDGEADDHDGDADDHDGDADDHDGDDDAHDDVRSRFGSLDASENVASCFGIPEVDEDAVFTALVQMAASQLSLGHSVVIQAPLPHRAQIDLLLDAANSTQATLIVLELRMEKLVNRELALPELLSEYDLNDVPKLVLPELNPFRYPNEVILDFILMASSMNHWHVGDGTESVLKDGGCKNEVKFRHFSHRQPFTLIEQKASTEASLPLPIEYYCDCCMEQITSDQRYYLCDHCDFSLHKSCAELPQCWDAPFHVHPLRLMILEHERDKKTRIVSFLGRKRTEPLISCIVCKQGTENGPFYRCWSCYAFFIHHQCAVPLMEDVRHECHAHPLRFHTLPEEKTFNCFGCGGEGKSVCYRCSECQSIFHLECAMKLTLTPSVKHKCHWDTLVLTSTPPKDDSDEYYCEVCTQRRHGDHWIYYCKPCEYEAHPHCVNPDIPPYTMPKDSSLGEWEDEEEASSEEEDEEEASSEEEDEEEASSEEEDEEEASSGFFLSCIPAGYGSASDDDLPYRIARMI